MRLTRLDLDGAGSPLGLVAKILNTEPDLPVPVPIESLARQLDIGEIRDLETEGFEGGLLTDEIRSFGGILVRRGMNRRRRRFTIGHELGHFLMPFHRPARAGKFLCTSADMRRWVVNEQNRAWKMEVQANQFSAAILMPPPHLRQFLARSGDPDLKEVLAVHEEYDVSKEAAARAYVQYHRRRVCVVMTTNGNVARIYRGSQFPRVTATVGDPLPRHMTQGWGSAPAGLVGPLRTADPGDWLETVWGSPAPELYEQVLVQANGFGTILLWAEDDPEADEFDPDEDKTAKERYRDRLSQRA